MATQSAAPLNPTDDKPQNPALEGVQPTIEDQHDANTEASRGISSTSVFVNSEPMREEQVQNAVKFLSHPKVRGSPVIYRRSFLEKKGLTKEEIDEAFRRVPDPPQNVSSVQPAGTNQDGQMKPLSNVQPQVSTQTLQPSAAAPAGVISKVGTLTQSRFHWSHAVFAVGLLALSGAGTAVLFKNAIVPRLKSWIRKVAFEEEESAKKPSSKPSLEQEATAAAKAAAAAAADVARASQEMLISKTEEKKHFEELMNLIGLQVQEMKSMSNAIRKLEGQGNNPGKIPLVEQDHQVSFTNSRPSNGNGKVDYDLYSGARSSSPPATVEPSVAPHPKNYMEIMAMVQRGEKPPNIREINDLPPNPNQPLPNPHSAPRAKPWEVGQSQSSFSKVIQSRETSNGLNSNFQDNGLVNQLNVDSSVPWWQRKNVRITEIGNEDESKIGYSGVLPVQRSWVPPQPPPVAMPEAAAAIRQPKKPLSQKQLADDGMVANPSDSPDELQRITKISESGGVVDVNGGYPGLDRQFSESRGVADPNGGSSGMHTSEIQEVQEEY
ncbi:Peroxisomal membrane protein PEX14 [Camellia lanceoleosa]|uniref:Peroxisomal membrane protein PEX14 n=1 Tax=Camellia lanceoleosa TaxID=1840588 RepID=A0ACC0FEF9_9ERIC|nr:Peroxisomal membrane protein PEX14 [Camellia lanceoleosa]